MLTYSLKSGIQAALKRPALAALLFAVNLILSLLVIVPLTLALTNLVSGTGYGSDLASSFDLAVWADILREGRASFFSTFGMFIRVGGLLLLWKVAYSVGLVHALGLGGDRSFWQGLGRWTGRGLLLAFFYLLGVIAVVVLVVIVSLILTTAIPGEQATFWIPWVISPVVTILGLAVVDLMHDWARIELVLGHKGTVDAALAGLKWPFRSGAAVGIHAVWLSVSVLLLWVPTWLDWSMGGLWGMFLIQQVFLLARAGLTVAWFGSEVALFERVRTQEAPLIAEDVSMTVDPQYG